MGLTRLGVLLDDASRPPNRRAGHRAGGDSGAGRDAPALHRMIQPSFVMWRHKAAPGVHTGLNTL